MLAGQAGCEGGHRGVLDAQAGQVGHGQFILGGAAGQPAQCHGSELAVHRPGVEDASLERGLDREHRGSFQVGPFHVQLTVDIGQVQLERRRHHRPAPVGHGEGLTHRREGVAHSDKPLNVITVKDPDHRTAFPLKPALAARLPAALAEHVPQGVFPWQAAPTGKPRDVTTIRQQLAVFRACLNWLMGRGYVDRSRVAVVGHDYGAMYGALLANADPRVHAAVLATPDATWGHWFVKYWLGFTGKRAARYDALFAGLPPVRHVSRLGKRELFQWADQDIFVSASVRQRFARHAPRARVDIYPTSDHQLTDAAQADRDAFLEHELSLAR